MVAEDTQCGCQQVWLPRNFVTGYKSHDGLKAGLISCCVCEISFVALLDHGHSPVHVVCHYI